MCHRINRVNADSSRRSGHDGAVMSSRRSGHDGAVSSHHRTLAVHQGLELREGLVQRLLHTTTELSAMIDDRQWLQVLVHHLVQLIIA